MKIIFLIIEKTVILHSETKISIVKLEKATLTLLVFSKKIDLYFKNFIYPSKRTPIISIGMILMNQSKKIIT